MTTKAEFKALEKIFAAEVNNRLPYQSKAKIFTKLAEQGLIEPMTREFRDRFGVMQVKGWELSHTGRLIYCASCNEDAP